MAEPVRQQGPERAEGRKTWDPAQAEGPSGNKRGLECRYCGCKHFRVVYTRPTWGARIMRRRECRNCGKRLTTWEKGLV
jgi:hypothetical protein